MEGVAGPRHRLGPGEHLAEPGGEQGHRDDPRRQQPRAPPAAGGDRADAGVRHGQHGRDVQLVGLRWVGGQQGPESRDRHAQHLAGRQLLEAGRPAERHARGPRRPGGFARRRRLRASTARTVDHSATSGSAAPATSCQSDRSDARAMAAVSSASARSSPSRSSPRTTAAPRAAAYASKSCSPRITPWCPSGPGGLRSPGDLRRGRGGLRQLHGPVRRPAGRAVRRPGRCRRRRPGARRGLRPGHPDRGARRAVGCRPRLGRRPVAELRARDTGAAPRRRRAGGRGRGAAVRRRVFDVAVAQLVVPFMADPVRGLSEMRRVVRPGGTVAACAWDFERGPVQVFWQAAEELFPGASAWVDLPGAREGQLAELMATAGLEVAQSTTLGVRVEISTFEEWWAPFGFRIGPAGEYFATLDGRRAAGAADALRRAPPGGADRDRRRRPRRDVAAGVGLSRPTATSGRRRPAHPRTASPTRRPPRRARSRSRRPRTRRRPARRTAGRRAPRTPRPRRRLPSSSRHHHGRSAAVGGRKVGGCSGRFTTHAPTGPRTGAWSTGTARGGRGRRP